MKVALIAALSTAVIAVGVAQAFTGDSTSTPSKPAATTTQDRSTTTEDRQAPPERFAIRADARKRDPGRSVTSDLAFEA